MVRGALFRNIWHNLSGLPRERLPPSATRRTRSYAVVPQRGEQRNEQRAVIRFLWAKGLDANEIHSEMRPVYGDKCFTRPAICVWCTKFACGRETIVDKERPGRHVVATTDATIAAVDAFVRSDGTNV